MGASDVAVRGRGWGADATAIAWSLAAGLAAGAAVGYLVAGPASRLLMLALRLTSPDAVRGVTSDDGFTIGRMTADTLSLLIVCGMIGAAAGVAYTLLRPAIPNRAARRTLWTCLSGALGGAAIVHTDGVDFRLLEPTALAVGGFVALLAGCGLLIAILVDRWSAIAPGRDAPTMAIAVAAVSAPFALPIAAAAFVVLLALARLPSRPGLARAARLSASAVVVALIALGAVDLARDVATLA